MASCAQIESLAQAYVDGELASSETAAFEQHVGQCRACAYTLERQRATATLLSDVMTLHRQPRSLVPDIMAHLPEMDNPRLMQQMNERAKRQPSRVKFFLTFFTPAVAVLVLLVTAFALVYSWPNPETTMAQAIGAVTFTQGEVKSLMPEANAFVKADLSNSISRDQIFETGEASAMIASIAGPSMVKVADNSRIKVNDDRRIGLQSGKIWLHVAKSGKGARVFRVSSPHGTITVFGTTFGVEVMPEKTLVTLLEGEVTVENDVTFATLHPNEQIELKAGVSPLLAYPVNASEVLSWADKIQPDGMTQAGFLNNIHPFGETILRAENVWRVDTGTHSVSSISFGWKPNGVREGLCSYVIYVTDDSGNPLFVGRIEARDLTQQGRTQIELNVPGTALKPNTTAFIRLVPDTASGSIETDFNEVAFVGV